MRCVVYDFVSRTSRYTSKQIKNIVVQGLCRRKLHPVVHRLTDVIARIERSTMHLKFRTDLFDMILNCFAFGYQGQGRHFLNPLFEM